MGSIVSSGLAHGHRSNPIAVLRVQKLYGFPVLLSGLASLTMLKSELNTIEQHFNSTLRCSQKLPSKTPLPVILFLSGSLPAVAELHLRQIGLFAMICRLPDGDTLKMIAHHQLSFAKASSGSWFLMIRNLCIKYSLPHPLDLMEHPPLNEHFKKLAKAHIIDYWEQNLRLQSSSLTSLAYFHPNYMSLTRPHPLWTTARDNVYEINKAMIQAWMLSGRYMIGKLTKHWDNLGGHCWLPSCMHSLQEESIEHMLTWCPSLAEKRQQMYKLWHKFATQHPHIEPILKTVTNGSVELKCQFILDCSVLPDVIRQVQLIGEDVLNKLFYLTRTYCHSLHRTRQELLTA